MSSSGFGPRETYSVFEGLRPDAGERLDHLSIATYSVDLVAVAALLLSIGPGGEEELRSGRQAFADAVRDLKSRIVILHQTGQAPAPARHREILHLLDTMMRPVAPSIHASWHPKVMLGRYLSSRGSAWRLWLGSRNLSRGRDREAGLLLTGVRSRTPDRTGTAKVLKQLFADGGWSPEALLELDGLRWSAPDGVRLRGLHWRDLGERRTFVDPLPRVRSTLVVSPFMDDEGLALVPPSPDTRLLTTRLEASRLTRTDPGTLRISAAPRYDPDEAAEVGVDDEPLPLPPGGLHAKLILQRSASRNRLWIGSANATRRGLAGPNAELMAALEVPDEAADALDQFWRDSAEPEPEDAPDAEAIRLEAARRRLDIALCELFKAEFRLIRDEMGLLLECPQPLDRFLRTHALTAGLMTLPDTAVAWALETRRVRICGPETPLRLQTALVVFTAETLTEPVVRRTWIQAAAFPGFDPEARDHAALAVYIGPQRMAAWWRAQLEGLSDPGDDGETWSGERRRGAFSQGAPAVLRPFTLENVLAAWARAPLAFEAQVERMDGLLSAFRSEFEGLEDEAGDEARAWLVQITPFWDALRGCLDLKTPHVA